MIKGIELASKIEKNYLRCTTLKGKAKWCQKLQDLQPEEGMNFGVKINLLSGIL